MNLLAVLSVDVTSRFDPTKSNRRPIDKIDMDSIILIIEKY